MEADCILIRVERAEQLSYLCHVFSPIRRFFSLTPLNNHAGEQASESNDSHLELTFSLDDSKSLKLFSSSRYKLMCQNSGICSHSKYPP